MIRWIGAIFDRICVVICAVVCVQFPLFISQYIQQLIGREAELRLQMSSMERAANVSGKTLPQFIQKFLDYPDVDFVLQGEIMQSIVNRWKSISEALLSLQNSSALGRPFSFFAHLDGETFHSALYNYTFGLPMTWEGGLYALIGVTIGYILCSFLRGLFRSRKKMIKTV